MNLNAHNQTQLERFLDEKGAEYAPFDPTRAPRILKQLQIPTPPKRIIVQVIGTNGKGSTGRFLSLMLHQLGIKVGHFSSPHLLTLCERFWKNGAILSRDALNEAFLALDSMAESQLEQASYFEALTFLALKVFEDCEVLVLEAGLGGEFDSTTTCAKADLTLFSSISLDHQEILGNTLEEIATTKLRAMSKRAILGFQSEEPYGEKGKVVGIIQRISQKIAGEKQAKLEILDVIPSEISQWILARNYPHYQAQNLTLAYRGFLAAQDLLATKKIWNQEKLQRFAGKFALDCMLESLPLLDLQGRMQRFAPNVYLDVAHNVDAAYALVKQIKNDSFSQNKCVLVYNSYFDKNPYAILSILKPIIKRVEILEVPNERIIEKAQLEKILQELEIKFQEFKMIEKQENYLVCGSFSVVAEFLARFSKTSENEN